MKAPSRFCCRSTARPEKPPEPRKPLTLFAKPVVIERCPSTPEGHSVSTVPGFTPISRHSWLASVSAIPEVPLQAPRPILRALRGSPPGVFSSASPTGPVAFLRPDERRYLLEDPPAAVESHDEQRNHPGIHKQFHHAALPRIFARSAAAFISASCSSRRSSL